MLKAARMAEGVPLFDDFLIAGLTADGENPETLYCKKYDQVEVQ